MWESEIFAFTFHASQFEFTVVLYSLAMRVNIIIIIMFKNVLIGKLAKFEKIAFNVQTIKLRNSF